MKLTKDQITVLLEHAEYFIGEGYILIENLAEWEVYNKILGTQGVKYPYLDRQLDQVIYE